MVTLSILGLYRANPTLFDGMVLPSGVDKDTLLTELLSQCAEFEILYPDPDFMRLVLDSWARTCLFKWQKLADTMALSYDPISNYDRHEEWTDTDNRKEETEVTPGSTETTAQQGYENSGFVDAAKLTRGGKDASTLQHSGDLTRTGRAWGNIGVTTSQQMIESEREVSDFNIYQVIIDDFKRRFCLLVY